MRASEGRAAKLMGTEGLETELINVVASPEIICFAPYYVRSVFQLMINLSRYIYIIGFQNLICCAQFSFFNGKKQN